MSQNDQLIAVYLLCYHSHPPETLAGTKRQFRIVEQAIKQGEWPYDNGDDPSFYVARKGGLLTWGVCRQEVRNSISKGSVAVFFSFTPLLDGQVLYRLCAVTNVVSKVDVRAREHDSRFARFRGMYINSLIRRDNGGWRHDESDRPEGSRHENWLWRIADHHGLKHEDFNKRYSDIYQSGWISDSALKNHKLKLADNYVLLSTTPAEAYISPAPPEVAIAKKGENERWINRILQSLTVGTAAKYLTSKRDYLRVVNKSHRNVHRHIVFYMPVHEMVIWREELIAAFKKATERMRNGNGDQQAYAQGRSRC